MSQQDLADAAGIALSTIKRLESTGAHAPRPDTLQRLAEALEVPVEALFGQAFEMAAPANRSLEAERSQLLGANFLRLQSMSTEKLRKVDEMLEAVNAMDDDDFQNPRKQ